MKMMQQERRLESLQLSEWFLGGFGFFAFRSFGMQTSPIQDRE